MSHWANIDENNIVINVIYIDNIDMSDAEAEGWVSDNLEGTWVQTSYNSSFRKNYAGIGFFFDIERDAFIPPKPSDNWILNEDTCSWEPPEWDSSATSPPVPQQVE
jgi:hypothetical protein